MEFYQATFILKLNIDWERNGKKITAIFIHSCKISCSLLISYQITNHIVPLENVRHCSFLDLPFYMEYELIHSWEFKKSMGLSAGLLIMWFKTKYIYNKMFILDSHGPNECKFSSKTLKNNVQVSGTPAWRLAKAFSHVTFRNKLWQRCSVPLSFQYTLHLTLDSVPSLTFQILCSQESNFFRSLRFLVSPLQCLFAFAFLSFSLYWLTQAS